MIIDMAKLKQIFDSSYIPEPNSGCWLWTGRVNDAGYGFIESTKNKVKEKYRASRMSIILDGREMPSHLFALHHCDTPSCVNPNHLYAGTLSQNQQDIIKRNRRPYIKRKNTWTHPSITEDVAAHIMAHLKLLSGYGKVAIVSRQTGFSRQVVRGVNEGRLYPGVEPKALYPIAEVGSHKAGRGSLHNKAKLNEESALEIRLSESSIKYLAERYDVSTSTIRLIRSGRLWRHIGKSAG